MLESCARTTSAPPARKACREYTNRSRHALKINDPRGDPLWPAGWCPFWWYGGVESIFSLPGSSSPLPIRHREGLSTGARAVPFFWQRSSSHSICGRSQLAWFNPRIILLMARKASSPTAHRRRTSKPAQPGQLACPDGTEEAYLGGVRESSPSPHRDRPRGHFSRPHPPKRHSQTPTCVPVHSRTPSRHGQPVSGLCSTA